MNKIRMNKVRSGCAVRAAIEDEEALTSNLVARLSDRTMLTPTELSLLCGESKREIERLQGEIKDRDVFLELADTKIAVLEKLLGGKASN